MLYIDVDAACKLAHWNILQGLPELTGFQWNEIATVSSLKYRAQRATAIPDGRLFHTADAAKNVLACLEQMGELPEPQIALFSMFENSQQIDTGEAVLLALAMGDTQGYFMTGDKRALRAISQLRDCVDSISGRIIMIEQILLMSLERKGHSWLQENVCPNKNIDKAVSVIMGSRCDCNEENIRSGLGSYIAEIGALCEPTLLVAKPCVTSLR